MYYVGIQTQQRRNNWRSAALLFSFPLLVVALTFVVVLALVYVASNHINKAASDAVSSYGADVWSASSELFVGVLPWVLGGVAVWFLIAYLFNTQIINRAVRSQPLERSQNKRIYNLVENLTMSVGMPMPKINVIDTPALNAFASGINDRTYTVTLTSGIIETLDDEQLEGVIAHELTHIRNRDVRVLVVSIVFVGIFSLIMSLAFHAMGHVRGKNSGSARLVLLVVALVAGLGVLISSLMKFAISRKREFMADAGAAEMTKKPLALAGALRMISGHSYINGVERDDVAQLFIDHGKADARDGDEDGSMNFSNPFAGLFATHPPIERRIEVLEQF